MKNYSIDDNGWLFGSAFSDKQLEACKPPTVHVKLVHEVEECASGEETEVEPDGAYAMTLEAIGEEIGMTREGVRVLIERALQKLRPVAMGADLGRPRYESAEVQRRLTILERRYGVTKRYKARKKELKDG